METEPGSEVDEDFERLLEYLKESRGFDFTGYKRASLMRRVRYRMGRIGIDEFDGYLDHLQVRPDEFTTLFNTILINVTSFFRDAEAWKQLREEVVPAVLRDNPEGDLRIWSAGCATGEEPYGLAIAFCEALGETEFRSRVKVYATDVDEEALTLARAAAYDERAIAGLEPELIDRYFDRQNGAFVFRKELRRSVIFGRNDLMQDAPISRIDLLACRNTLMYFTAETQARILARLHFALRPQGFLFLGRAELLLSHSTRFAPLDARRRFFRKLSADERTDRRVLIEARPLDRRVEADPPDDLAALALHGMPLAQLVVGPDGALALANRRAGTLLGVGAGDLGRPIQDLEVSYRPAELRSMMAAARSTRRPQWLREVPTDLPGGDRVYLDVQVVPLLGTGPDLAGFSVLFHDVTRRRELQEQLERSNAELEAAHGELQTANEELETTNEELQSTNEELETTNEELQSSNEELETMNEELHSMNEELESINEELRERSRDLARANRFMESILIGIRSAVVVVDQDSAVQMWNTVAEDLWGLRQDEVLGVPLRDLDVGLPVTEILDVVRQVGVTTNGEQRFDVVSRTRRGRLVRLAGTASRIQEEDTGAPGVLLLLAEDGALTAGADGSAG